MAKPEAKAVCYRQSRFSCPRAMHRGKFRGEKTAAVCRRWSSDLLEIIPKNLQRSISEPNLFNAYACSLYSVIFLSANSRYLHGWLWCTHFWCGWLWLWLSFCTTGCELIGFQSRRFRVEFQITKRSVLVTWLRREHWWQWSLMSQWKRLHLFWSLYNFMILYIYIYLFIIYFCLYLYRCWFSCCKKPSFHEVP